MDQATLTNTSLQAEIERLRVLNRTLAEENRLLRQSRDLSQRGEQRYRLLTENTLDLICEVSQHGVYTYVSPNHEDVLGYRPKELLGQNFAALIHEDDMSGVVEKFSECIVGGLPYEATFRIRHKDGAYRWLETTGKPLETVTAPGAPVYEGQAVLVSRDVSERRETRRALATESDRLAVMLRSISDGVVATDLQGRVAQVNDAALRLTGLKLDEFVGQPIDICVQFLDEGHRAPLRNPAVQVLAEGVESSLPLTGHALLRSSAGVEFIVAGSASPIRDHDDALQGSVLVFRDISDRRRTEQELLKLNKQESLGQLAARIAHDFNNLLTVILGNLSLAKILLAPGDAALRRLVDTEKACLRAKDLTRQLLAFARGGLPVKKPLALEPLVRESARLIMQDSAVPYRLNWDAPLPTVMADAEQLHQLLFELLTNAVHATPLGGTIHLRGEVVLLDSRNTLPLPEGEYVRLTVRDEGKGIPEQHLTRIFEPFFTTKENARGLGLATCFLIARNHDGFMTVDSTPGASTEFHLYLPALPAEAQPPPPPFLARPPLQTMRHSQEAVSVAVIPAPVSPVRSARASAGRILVMDDEAPICELAAELLGRNGYEVHTAADGAEAIKKYLAAREVGRPFDVVILDLTVRSGLGGLETIAQLRQIDAGVKAIVSSGYSQDPIMSQYREQGFCGVVTKPYSISELMQEVEQAAAE
jgi:PAS domain S-box-containing protein